MLTIPGRRYLVRTLDTTTGQEVYVEVDAPVAEVLAEQEPRLKERLLKRAANIEKVMAPADEGLPWEGPRLRFTALYGASAIWSGPGSLVVWCVPEGQPIEAGEWRCRFCGHVAEMGAEGACLGCDRTGLDARIGAPNAEDAKRREGMGPTKMPEGDGLDGGTGRKKKGGKS